MHTTFSQSFNTRSLLKFAAPSILMMILLSLYTIVDGIFVSRLVGSNALSSLNIVYPIINIVVAIGTMLATGGNAIMSRYLGQNRLEDAKAALSEFVALGLLVSFVLMIFSQLFKTQISYFLGSNDLLLKDCNIYLSISMYFAPACMLQTLFQSYFVTSGNSKIGLILSFISGVFNVVFDYVLIVIFHMGVAGAALATGLGQLIPAVVGIYYFFFRKTQLKFSSFSFNVQEILEVCYNGSSEMVSQLSNAIMTFLFNIILMRLAGANGVAAITILLYTQFLFNAFYLGFSIGISPIVGYKYGANELKELKHIYKVTFLFTALSSVVIFAVALASTNGLVGVFTHEKATYDLAVTGFKLFAINFLFSGLNILSSGFFPALSNGKISELISFCRTLIFTSISLIFFSHIFGIIGAWIAVPLAEILTLLLCVYLHRKYFLSENKISYFD